MPPPLRNAIEASTPGRSWPWCAPNAAATSAGRSQRRATSPWETSRARASAASTIVHSVRNLPWTLTARRISSGSTTPPPPSGAAAAIATASP